MPTMSCSRQLERLPSHRHDGLDVRHVTERSWTRTPCWRSSICPLRCAITTCQGKQQHLRVVADQQGSQRDRSSRHSSLVWNPQCSWDGQIWSWEIRISHATPGLRDIRLTRCIHQTLAMLPLRGTTIGPIVQLLVRATTPNTVTSRAYNCRMRRVAVAPLVEASLIRNRKTVSHCDLAGFALSAVLPLPPIYQIKSALAFAPSFASGTRRGVRDECGIEEGEELPEEGLQRRN
jgi:hypothetical protein